MRETEEQRVRLSSSIGPAILGADGSYDSEQLRSIGEKRGDGRWFRKGEEGTLRDL